MRNIAAYLLLQAGGNQKPTAADIKKLLATVGIETEDSRLESLVSELEAKSTADLIAEGCNKLASVPSGGGGGGGSVAAPAGGGGGGGAAAAVVEEKKEEKVEEKEESDDDMGFGLFD